jgi:succinyl-CoA synthetase beta subunit
MKRIVKRSYLKALGLEEGTITYVPNLGKDMVLEMRFKGRNLKVGDRVLKSSKIDLVLGMENEL